MEDQGKEVLYKFILTQTVSNECFTQVMDYIRDKFNTHLNTKYKERFNANRKRKKELQNLMDAELKAFKQVSDRYLTMTNKMLKHFDNWENIDKLSNDVDDLYDYLDKK